MKYVAFFITLCLFSCSPDEHSLATKSKGTLTLDVNILDTSGLSSSQEKSIKNSLAVTLLDEHEVVIQSWNTLDALPRRIPLASGTYYAIVKSKDVAPSKENTLTYYAKTAPIQITQGQHQSTELTFEDQMSPPDFSDFSFD